MAGQRRREVSASAARTRRCSAIKGGTWFAAAMKRGTPSHKWEFKSRFRRHAFGWRSLPAIQRINQAASEIKKIAQRDPLLGGEGAVLLLERISPALENVDSSSGAIGTAVNHAISDLIPIIAEAPAGGRTREAWLERLWAAHEADQMPYGTSACLSALYCAGRFRRSLKCLAVTRSGRTNGGPSKRPPR